MYLHYFMLPQNKDALKLKRIVVREIFQNMLSFLTSAQSFFFDQNGCKQVAVAAFFPLKEAKTEG